MFLNNTGQSVKSFSLKQMIGIFFDLFLSLCVLCARISVVEAKNSHEDVYNYTEYPLARNNVKLHLDRITKNGEKQNKNILLIHGVTYSSHEFDINYEDYSLVRALVNEGYSAWRLDIAGFGRSEAVADGFMPNSDYAAEDINAAVEKIIQITGQEKIDLLGWSWGTVTASRFASKHPERLNKLILYAPILSGLGKCDADEPFHLNSWEHAVDDFQSDKNGNIDYSITDPILVELWASGCWHYDGDKSPNGGRRDICVDNSQKLIDLSRLKTPTLLIYGDKDPYLNYQLLETEQALLPKGSSVKSIKGGAHAVYVEKPHHKNFQSELIRFLKN